ncbi:MAG: hypothetical protein HY300_12020, partial [Verrucomicrobia bacterium]|nr:hypothetical protein [Verrucomicrobiota bacterium]
MNTQLHRTLGSARTALLCLVAAVGTAGATFFYLQKEKAALREELTAARTQLSQLQASAVDA